MKRQYWFIFLLLVPSLALIWHITKSYMVLKLATVAVVPYSPVVTSFKGFLYLIVCMTALGIFTAILFKRATRSFIGRVVPGVVFATALTIPWVYLMDSSVYYLGMYSKLALGPMLLTVTVYLITLSLFIIPFLIIALLHRHRKNKWFWLYALPGVIIAYPLVYGLIVY